MILREAPEVSLLVTSREGLRVPGEQLYSVPSLDDDAAVALFVERATEVDSRFTVDHNDRSAVASLCARLDGVPLAIELAAARARMFNLDELARRVDQRFRLLTGGRGAIERHQTLRAAIDWSFDLLETEERVAFARFSVFAGGTTLEAAEAVVADTDGATDDVLDVLTSLVDKSLLIVDRSRASTRYGMFETIRQYAQERLVDSDDAETVRARHARWYADFARAAGRGLYTPEERAWVERLQAEIDNLQVAVTWSIAANETELAMRFGGSFPRQAMARPFIGTAYLAEQAMHVKGFDEHALRARVMAEAAWACLLRGDGQGAEVLLARAIDAQRHGARYAAAAYTYSLIGLAWEWTERAYEIAKEGLERAEAVGDVLGAVGSRIAFASQAMLMERQAEAIEHAERALAEARALRQPTLEMAALYACGLAFSKADPSRAIELPARIGRSGFHARQRERTCLLACVARRARSAPRRRPPGSRRSPRANGRQISDDRLSRRRSVHRDRSLQPPRPARSRGPVRRPVPAAAVRRNCSSRLHPCTSRSTSRPSTDARQTLGDQAFEQHFNDGASVPPEQVREAILQELDKLIAATSSG